MAASPSRAESQAPAEAGGVDPSRRLAELSDVITPWAIRVAATLRLSDLLARGLTGVDELATACGADPGALERLLRYLAHRGVVARSTTGGYRPTPLSALLEHDHPAGRRDWLDLEGVGGRNDQAFAGLLAAVRTGRPGYQAVHGLPFWADLAAHPQLQESFDRLMGGHASELAEVAEQAVWASAEHVIDVGGAPGAFAVQLLRRHPQLRVTVFDLPGAVDGTRTTLTAAGVGDRAEAVAGSFLERLPAGADRYALCNVLHDWPDDEAVTILANCATAAAPHGRVVIAEEVPDQVGNAGFATAMDLRMLVLLGGRERPLAELEQLAGRAALRVLGTSGTKSGYRVVECAPLPSSSRDQS